MEELTRLEERIMQCILDYQGEVPFLDLIETVKEKLNKDYKRTSIRGYLFRLEEKGYIKLPQLDICHMFLHRSMAAHMLFFLSW